MSDGWNSDDYAEEYKKLAEVSDKGVEIIFKKISYNHGENDYHAVHGIENGESVAYLFSSNGLMSLFVEKQNEIRDKKIAIIPSGTDTERRYKVKRL